MSDLQCPATVLVLRHGQSAGNVSRRLSSAAPGGELTEHGRQQAADAAATLVDRNIARVYASPLVRAQQTAQIVAETVGAGPVQLLDDVREFSLGECEGSDTDEDWARVDGLFDSWLNGHLEHALPGGESGLDVLARIRSGLEAVADQHRGETVVVVSHGGVMSMALPLIAGDVRDDRARGSGVPNCGLVEMQGDADGWSLVAWPTRSPALGSDPHPGDLAELVDRADSERNEPPPLPPDRPPLPGSAYATVRGIACASLPIAQAWATQASVTGLGFTPSPGAVDEVTAWLDDHSPSAWHLVVGEHWAPEVAARHGLVEVMRHGVWVCEEVAGEPDVLADVRAEGLTLEPAADVAEFVSVFGADLAPIVEGQLDLPDRAFPVLRHDGRVVGCARLRDLAGTTYVGGITVLREFRGRGWGLALSALATRSALQRSPIAWLHCEDTVAGLYARLGYRRVTTHVHLGPAATQS
ncbi:bifunctional histidine phosphatase family protein/GNAT family N-acetyltransferase [Angustibacter luteus]|uniref:Bifunctional histidine phosphatase family protein/GNAT family N-acetyltransferase n=1 Tax=Angustibacter luteus TaxID=658456 RepID=A0ABW1JI29_9ACTN